MFRKLSEGFEKVSELNLSDFKMFEKASYEKIDIIKVLDASIKQVEEKAKKHGSEYIDTYTKHILKAVSRQTGKEAPQDIKTLGQLRNYLISKSEELQNRPHFLMFWAFFVTDKKFETNQEEMSLFMFKNAAQRMGKLGTK